MSRPSVALNTAMAALSRLAGWQTLPHPDDHAVVRLALTTARERHNPDAGGDSVKAGLVDRIEETWLRSQGLG